ncbi:MAG: hypothetical protein NC084_12890 [Bacteroides sp.]|nr:hypothetical protein [Eubacterium sp.]MCM1419570.1 hypothetical protein [Roseburia sp.]MCM1463591.1 hypothetical protein [Bacteroides sp.]
MTPQSEAIALILEKLKVEEDCAVTVSAMPPEGGITTEITGGESKSRSLNLQHGSADLTVLFLCKNKDQAVAFDTLNRIGNFFGRLKPIVGNTVQITGARVGSGTSLIGKEGDLYLYGLIARIGIYF